MRNKSDCKISGGKILKNEEMIEEMGEAIEKFKS